DIVDADALRERLNALTQGGANPASPVVRGQVLHIMKDTLRHGRARAEALLSQDGGGTLCARRLSHLMDVVICALYDFVSQQVYPVSNRSKAETMAIVAVGGYGRGGLAPGSDIDLKFILPYKQTPWGEQIVEYILYMLWDMGLKVGHATRNIDESIRLARE